jgi:hypothetical protein
MADLMPPTPDKLELPADGPPPRGETPTGEPDRPIRYDANLRLIHRRLADEKRTAKARRWWKPGS